MTNRYFRTAFLTLCVLAIAASPLAAQSKKQREQAKKLQDAGDQSFAAKNYADAADKYGQSLTIVATNPYGHYKKGFAHFELKQYDPALTEFTAALSQGFRPLEVYRVRTYIYLDRKDWDAAIGDAKAALALAPRDPQFAKALVEAYLGKNDTASALDMLQKASTFARSEEHTSELQSH